MTERKPREMTFASWVDQQVSEAAERGAFDNLPGAGKPISRRGGTDAWLQDYLRREGVSADELLPTPLRLRKEIERLTETVQDLRSEDEVRAVVKGLNRRIVEWRRIRVRTDGTGTGAGADGLRCASRHRATIASSSTSRTYTGGPVGSRRHSAICRFRPLTTSRTSCSDRRSWTDAASLSTSLRSRSGVGSSSSPDTPSRRR